MLKTVVLKPLCYIPILARWSHLAPLVIHIPVGGICPAGPPAEIRCGDLEIHLLHHYLAEVIILHGDSTNLLSFYVTVVMQCHFGCVLVTLQYKLYIMICKCVTCAETYS